MFRLLAVFAFLVLSWSAHAGEPRALVMDVVGETSPDVFAFDEIDAGTTITLVGDAEISMTFYPTCEDVTIRGGSIKVHDEAMMVEDPGIVVNYTKGECPGAVKLVESDIINAAIITRSATITHQKIALRPRIAVIGPDTDGYDRVAIHGSDGIVASMRLDGNAAVWPDGQRGLKAGGRYLVAVTGTDVPIRIAKVVAEAEAPALLLLRQ